MQSRYLSRILSVWLLGSCLSTQGAIGKTSDIQITPQPSQTTFAPFNVKNTSFVPQTVSITAYKKDSEEVIGKTQLIIYPKTELNIKVFADTGKAFGAMWFYRSNLEIGDPSKTLSEQNYGLPFPTNTLVKICQSKDGILTSHIATPEAIDFCAPIRTPILAAKDGTVAEVEDSFVECGMDPSCMEKSNRIRVMHNDGSVADYEHIYQKSAKVKEGEAVKAGQQIAEIGATGQVTGAHLHFEVSYLGKH